MTRRTHAADVQGWAPDTDSGADADFVDIKFDTPFGSVLPSSGSDVSTASAGPAAQAMLAMTRRSTFDMQHHQYRRSQYPYVNQPMHLPSPPTTRNSSPDTPYNALQSRASAATTSAVALSEMLAARNGSSIAPSPTPPMRMPTPADSSAASSAAPPAKRHKTSTERKKERKLAENANYVPRPKNSFILFRTDFVAKHKARLDSEGRSAAGTSSISASGSASGGEDDETPCSLSKQASVEWNKMSDKEKEPWQKRAEFEKQEHARKHPNYRYRPVRNPQPSPQPQSQPFPSSGAFGIPHLEAHREDIISSYAQQGYRGGELTNAMFLHDQHSTHFPQKTHVDDRFPPLPRHTFPPHSLEACTQPANYPPMQGHVSTAPPQYFSIPQLARSNSAPLLHHVPPGAFSASSNPGLELGRICAALGNNSCPSSPDGPDDEEQEERSPLSSVSSLPTSPPLSPEEVGGAAGAYFAAPALTQDQAGLTIHPRPSFEITHTVSDQLKRLVPDSRSQLPFHFEQVGSPDPSVRGMRLPSYSPYSPLGRTQTPMSSPSALRPFYDASTPAQLFSHTPSLRMQPLEAVAAIVANQSEASSSYTSSSLPVPRVADSSLATALIDTTEMSGPSSVAGRSSTTEDAGSEASTVRNGAASGCGDSSPITDGQLQALSGLPSPSTASSSSDAATTRSLEAYSLAIGHAFAGSNEGEVDSLSSSLDEYDFDFGLGSGGLGLSLDDYFTLDCLSDSAAPEYILGQDWPDNVADMEDVRF